MTDWINNYKLITSTAVFAVMYSGIIAACFLITTETIERIFSLSLVLLGSAIGWALGTLFAPYAGEAQEFAQFTAYISTFLSGYALAKIDPLITKILSPEFALHISKNSAFRLCSFFSSVILSLIITFIFRRYAM